MKTNSDTLLEFGSIPVIEPEYLGGVLATSSDIALLVDTNIEINSLLLNKSEKLLNKFQKTNIDLKNDLKFLICFEKYRNLMPRFN